ncbi:MAG TPA: 50S ribosomal protein L23 [Candidatus Woesebacteria bacterium]|nr:50S ribosomal protein L23 [Candidatus Woesebacteria bacterium]HPJ16827.1 50S ribosomal protein L23 [Candidatus Woesebacteria bacterium]
MKIQNILLSPIVTEKALRLQDQGFYSFWVSKESNKNQIAAAFESVFKVKPQTVNTYTLKGKIKTDWKKRTPIQKSDRKKALIFVGSDKKIDTLTLKQK